MTTAPAAPKIPANAEDVAAVEASLANQILYRTALLHILELCTDELDRTQVEASVADLPEMATAPRSPASLVDSLIRAGALVSTVEADDTRMTLEQYRASLEPDRANHKTETSSEPKTYDRVIFLLVTTPAGAQVAQANASHSRLTALYDTHPDLVETFRDIVAFCREPRTFAQVCARLQELGHAVTPNKEGGPVVAPSFVLEHLQEAGALVWKEGGWRASDAGLQTAAPHTTPHSGI